MIALYSFAHSDPRGASGTSTLGGLREREVARAYFPEFRRVIEAAGHEVGSFGGPLGAVVRLMKKTASVAVGQGNRPVCIEVHFNNPPFVSCPVCGEMGYDGVPCSKCEAPPSHVWRWGHVAMINRHCAQSAELARCILGSLTMVMPWSRERDIIKMPDSRYGSKIWPRVVPGPAALIEVGFGVDKRFSDFLDAPGSFDRIGRAVAVGVLDFYEAKKNIPLDEWGK